MSRRRLLRVGLVVLLVAGGGFVWWITRPSELARVRAKLDATDPGWRFADVRGTRLADQPPPGENVVFVAVASKASIPKAFGEWQLKAQETGTWPERPSNHLPDDPAGVAAWRECAEAIAAARRCRELPRGMAQPVIPADPFMTLLPHVDDCRRVAELLRVDAVRAATHGDPAGAVASIRAIQSLARGVGREPFLISHLVAMAHDLVAADTLLRTLAVAELPADGLAEIQADLHRAAEPGRLASALRDWRAMADLEMSAIAAGDVDLRTAVALASNGRRPLPNMASRLSYRMSAVGVDHAALLTDLTALREVASRPPHEWRPAVVTVPLPPDDARHPFARSEGEIARKQFVAHLRQMTSLRVAAAAAGCERFRLQHGRWPTTVAELPGDFTDPHTGRPLILKRLPDGLLVYSVGADGTDDGGNLSEVGTPPRGTDIGSRLWDTAARRRPVRPEN